MIRIFVQFQLQVLFDIRNVLLVFFFAFLCLLKKEGKTNKVANATPPIMNSSSSSYWPFSNLSTSYSSTFSNYSNSSSSYATDTSTDKSFEATVVALSLGYIACVVMLPGGMLATRLFLLYSSRSASSNPTTSSNSSSSNTPLGFPYYEDPAKAYSNSKKKKGRISKMEAPFMNNTLLGYVIITGISKVFFHF